MPLRLQLQLAARHYALAVIAGFAVCGLLLGGTINSLERRVPLEKGLFPQGATYSGEIYRNDLDLSIASRSTFPSSGLNVIKNLGSSAGVTEKVVSFSVPDDGLTEYGLMTVPAGPVPAAGWPAIILCHGYANPAKYSETKTYIGDMDFYAQHGFAVIKPDYRGQGRSLHQGQADSGYYSMVYNTDVMSLISALKQTSYIDKNNLNLWGHSLGAYIALRAAVLSPDIKNLILLSGPVDNLSKMYLSYLPPSDENNLNALKTRQAVFAKYGPPTENTLFWRNASPINYLSQLTARVQIHVGQADQTVPPVFSADLDKALNNAGISHDYYVYPSGTHSLQNQRFLIWSRSLQLLKPVSPLQPGA